MSGLTPIRVGPEYQKYISRGTSNQRIQLHWWGEAVHTTKPRRVNRKVYLICTGCPRPAIRATACLLVHAHTHVRMPPLSPPLHHRHRRRRLCHGLHPSQLRPSPLQRVLQRVAVAAATAVAVVEWRQYVRRGGRERMGAVAAAVAVTEIAVAVKTA